MTSSVQPDPQYFRGKTLTPESPVPLHIPEPSHIPVLQNQIDPIFNLMSTHMDPPSTSSYAMISGNGLPQQGHTQAAQANTAAASLNNGIPHQDNLLRGREPDQEDKDYVLAFENEDLAERLADELDTDTSPNHLSTSVAQPSASAPAHETLSPHPQDDPSPYPHSVHTSLPEPSNVIPGSPQTAQAASLVEDRGPQEAPGSPSNSDDQTQDGGVNYQALLDNLSPSTATAPSADNIASITTAAPSAAPTIPRPSSTESPVPAVPLAPGLPPRPPPQEKPAIHPNYTTGEDIRSYHYPHVQATNIPAPSASQPNNPIRPVPGFTHPLPPNGSIGSNGLPPPPLATFQQSALQTAQPSQPSPITTQSRQPALPTQALDRNAVTLESSPDEPAWPAELERQYDEFTSEEAKYVAEGVWDRFPPGSRLFVGMVHVMPRITDCEEPGVRLTPLIGNLYSEKVTKRDLFYVFHRFGRLAQISIKNAYGFIQFFDAVCANRAISGEQGSTIRGRKIRESRVI